MNALKAQRNAQAKLATGMIPVVQLKSQADSESTSEPASEAASTSADSHAAPQAGSRAEAKKRKGSAKTAGSAEK